MARSADADDLIGVSIDIDSVSLAPSSSDTAMSQRVKICLVSPGELPSNPRGRHEPSYARRPGPAWNSPPSLPRSRGCAKLPEATAILFWSFLVSEPATTRPALCGGISVIAATAAHGWRLGTNRGLTEETSIALATRLRALATSRPVSLIGWSLGGVYALELAGAFPDAVRRVITLGSPLTLVSQRGQNAPVPVSALFSRTDGIVSWRNAIGPTGPNRENIEVDGSHLGLGHNPNVLLIIADRLARPQGQP